MSRVEAAPQPLAWKLLTWLNKHGYELPGNRDDWYLSKPELYGSRRSRYDMECGTMAWYLTYDGEDEEARHWSDTFGGELSPSRIINNLSEVEVREKYDNSTKYRTVAGYELHVTEDEKVRKKRKKTFHIWRCKHCGKRMEERKADPEGYYHVPCGEKNGKFEYVETITVEE